MLSFWNRFIQLNDIRMARKVFDWDYHNHAMEGCANWCPQIHSIFKVLDIKDIHVNKEMRDLSACKEMLHL